MLLDVVDDKLSAQWLSDGSLLMSLAKNALTHRDLLPSLFIRRFAT